MAQGQLTTTPRAIQATSGDDWDCLLTLWSAGALSILTGATIAASLITTSGRIAIAATALSSSATGAVWGSGRIALPFTAAQTANLVAGDYLVEVEVTLAGVKTTWPRVPVAVVRGAIT